jgi:hypothetical protein
VSVIGGGEQIEIVHAPALAEVIRAIETRPYYLRKEPIEVARHIFIEAQEQLKRSLEARGWPMVCMEHINRQHFLVHGVPVLMIDESA